MRPSIPNVQPQWLQAGERRQELLIISDPTPWVSHWDVQLRRSRRCGGSQCYACAIGMAKQLRVVVLGVDPHGREKLFELRERHRELFDREESTVGLRVTIRKEGSAKNSPVTVSIVGSEHAVSRDITRLVESFGLPPVLVAEGFDLRLERGDITPSVESGVDVNA